MDYIWYLMYTPSKTCNALGKLLIDHSVFTCENKNVNFMPYGTKLAQSNRIGLIKLNEHFNMSTAVVVCVHN